MFQSHNVLNIPNKLQYNLKIQKYIVLYDFSNISAFRAKYTAKIMILVLPLYQFSKYV